MTVFVSFATPDYELEVAGLVSSLETFGLDYRVMLMPKRRSWEETCARKPRFMLECMDALDAPICWVDADARVRRRPEMLLDPLLPECADVALHCFSPAEGYISGTVWANNTDCGRAFLVNWAKRCEAQPEVWDQVHLLPAISTFGYVPIRVERLSAAYCYIHDLSRTRYPGVDPIIEHYQASRRKR